MIIFFISITAWTVGVSWFSDSGSIYAGGLAISAWAAMSVAPDLPAWCRQ